MRSLLVLILIFFFYESRAQEPAPALSDSLRINHHLRTGMSAAEAADWKSKSGLTLMVECLCYTGDGEDSTVYRMIYGREGIFYVQAADSLLLYKVIFTGSK